MVKTSPSIGPPSTQGISKRGNKYIRVQLIHGARAAVAHFIRQTTTPTYDWVRRLIARAHLDVGIEAPREAGAYRAGAAQATAPGMLLASATQVQLQAAANELNSAPPALKADAQAAMLTLRPTSWL